jgi:hypothetical protein
MTDAIYTPLNGLETLFRLVSILPSPSFESEIQCTLITTPIDPAPSYEALSYCWGDFHVTENIIVSNHPFNATKSLASALRRLRPSDKPRMMWIDAICINQADIQERNHQVRQMQKIYQDAEQVVVWLGESERTSGSVMRVIRAIYQDDLHWDNLDSLLPGNNIEGLLFHLMNWLQRPWWDRVWTVQETILARRLIFVCGMDRCSGEEIFFAAKSFLQHKQSCCKHYQDQLSNISVDSRLSSHFSQIEAISEFQSRLSVSPIPLEDLLAQFRHRVASNPHDYIYGFLGLTSDVYREKIDYAKPFTDMFKLTTMTLIWNFDELDVLSQKMINHRQGRSDPKTDGLEVSYELPSWCPDWSRQYHVWELHWFNQRLGDIHYYNACAGKKAAILIPLEIITDDMQICAPRDTITLQGLRFDTICEVGVSMDSTGSSYNAASYREWAQMVKGFKHCISTKYANGQEKVIAFWHTLCAGIGRSETKRGSGFLRICPAESMDNSVFRDWWQHCVIEAPGFKGMPTSLQMMLPASVAPQAKWIYSIIDQSCAATIRRRFFITDQGYFGLASTAVQKGDMICVLFGGRVPYVLRWSSESSSHEFLGDAYVHGIMHGEVLKGLQSDDVRVQYFDLK